MADDRIVNQAELADLLEISVPTLRELIKKNADFPIETEGDHGVAYEFDAGKVAAWRVEHEKQIAAAMAARDDKLSQMRLELFPTENPNADAGLSAEALIKELELRKRWREEEAHSGNLLEKSEVDRVLRQALVELQKGMRQIGPDLARDMGLDRTVRAALEARIRARMNGLIDRIQDLVRGDDVRAA